MREIRNIVNQKYNGSGWASNANILRMRKYKELREAKKQLDTEGHLQRIITEFNKLVIVVEKLEKELAKQASSFLAASNPVTQYQELEKALQLCETRSKKKTVNNMLLHHVTNESGEKPPTWQYSKATRNYDERFDQKLADIETVSTSCSIYNNYLPSKSPYPNGLEYRGKSHWRVRFFVSPDDYNWYWGNDFSVAPNSKYLQIQLLAVPKSSKLEVNLPEIQDIHFTIDWLGIDMMTSNNVINIHLLGEVPLANAKWKRVAKLATPTDFDHKSTIKLDTERS